ncbi:MAG: ferrous iron transport protein A [Myxococcales bacterium]|nr:ferrous iron transport protein A [Myxococcales bacterium]
MTLASIPLHTPVVIVCIDGDRQYRRRLMELGFLPGVSVQVLGIAPFGDPLDIEIRGCRFSLRSAEAACVHVRAVSAEASAELAAK